MLYNMILIKQWLADYSSTVLLVLLRKSVSFASVCLHAIDTVSVYNSLHFGG